MEILRIYGIIICALCTCVVFKNMHSEYSLLIRLCVTVGVSISAISVLYPVLSYINQIASGTEIEKHIPSLIKALGIALAVQITADSCKDAGEETLASRVYLFGQAEILIISIPILKALFSLCAEILN
jgi:stage III sporulation protein AD